jgi:hypothetical protein
MIDKSNRPADIQQMAEDRIHWFFSLDAAGLGQLGQGLLQQQRRRGQGPRRLHQLSPRRRIGVGLTRDLDGGHQRPAVNHIVRTRLVACICVWSDHIANRDGDLLIESDIVVRSNAARPDRQHQFSVPQKPSASANW